MRINSGYASGDDPHDRGWLHEPETIAQSDLIKDEKSEEEWMEETYFPAGRTDEQKCADEAGLIREGLLEWGILSNGEASGLTIYFEPLCYAFRITPNEDHEEFFTIHAWVYFGLVQPTPDLEWWIKKVSSPAMDPVDVGFNAFIHRDIHLLGKLILNTEWSFTRNPSWSLTNDLCLWFVEMDEYRQYLEENHFYSPDTQKADDLLPGIIALPQNNYKSG
jgi:hypothetical protein